ATDDRLDARLFAGAVELDLREQIGIVRERQRRQPQFGRATDQVRLLRLRRIAIFRLFRDADGRIAQRIFAVGAQVDVADRHDGIRGIRASLLSPRGSGKLVFCDARCFRQYEVGGAAGGPETAAGSGGAGSFMSFVISAASGVSMSSS